MSLAAYQPKIRVVRLTDGFYVRPLVVIIDGRRLRDLRGKPRRFKTHDAARRAATKLIEAIDATC